jgi:UTP--glucose-1-phosphate uridylyltransferase
MPTVRKAIIPVAGLGTRFLPATKAQPKEMLPVVDKPVIQYIVEEAVAAGIEQVIFVTSSTKRAIEDHFDRNFELEYRLRQKGKKKALGEVLDISDLASFVYIRQRTPKGDGHAILQARNLVGDEPCVVLYGDNLFVSDTPCISQTMAVYEKYQDPVMMVQRVPEENVHRYGIIAGNETTPGVHEITQMVEKPKPEDAPSNLANLGQYILTPEFFDALDQAEPSPDGELRIVDGFRALLGKRSLYAHEFDGTYYDCGNKLGYLMASVDYGLKHAEANADEAFAEFLKGRVAQL